MRKELQIFTDAAELAEAVLEVWNARNLDRFEDLLANDVEWHDPAMVKPPTRGRDEARAFAESILRAFPDFRYEVSGSICVSADGTRCVIPWQVTATHLAPLVPPGFATTGRQVRQSGLDLIDIRDGRVSRILTCFDAIAAAEQLLAVQLRPVPGSLRDRLLVSGQRVLAFRTRRLTRR